MADILKLLPGLLVRRLIMGSDKWGTMNAFTVVVTDDVVKHNSMKRNSRYMYAIEYVLDIAFFKRKIYQYKTFPP